MSLLQSLTAHSPNNVPVTLLSVELQSKATSVTDSVRATTATKHSREAFKDRSGASGIRKNLCAGVLFQTLVHLESTESTSATGVDDTLGDAFVVEAVDLLTSHVVFQELRAGVVLGGDLQPVIGVGLLDTKVGGDDVARRMVVDGVSLQVGDLLVARGGVEAKLL